MHCFGEFDCLVLELQQLLVLVNEKQQCLCWQLPNVMFLYIILHMAIKLSRHQCQCFALSYHRQREISVYPISMYVQGWQQRYGWLVSRGQTFRGRERLVTIASIPWTTPECWRARKLLIYTYAYKGCDCHVA